MKILITNEQRKSLKKMLVGLLNNHRTGLFEEIDGEIVSMRPSFVFRDESIENMPVAYIEGIIKKLSCGESLLGDVTLILNPSEVDEIDQLLNVSDAKLKEHLKRVLIKKDIMSTM